MTTMYWYGGTGDWSDYTNHWSYNSGNSPNNPASSQPTSSDDVIIDSNSGFGSGGTITVDVSGDDEGKINNFTSSSGHTYTLTNSTVTSLKIYGSIVLESGLSILSSSYFSISLFGISGNKTITSNDSIIESSDLSIVGNATFTLLDNLNITGTFYQENGTFNANNYNITADNFYFYADTDYTPTIYMGSGTWESTGGTGVGSLIFTISEYSDEIVNIISETSTIKLSGGTGNFDTYYGSQSTTKTFNNILITGTDKEITFYQNSNIFNEFKVENSPVTIKIQGTINLSTFNVSGTVGNLITLDSISGIGEQFTLSKSSGIVNCKYLIINNSNVTGGATFVAIDSICVGNNPGWNFKRTFNGIGILI